MTPRVSAERVEEIAHAYENGGFIGDIIQGDERTPMGPIVLDLRDERARTAAYLELVRAAKAWRTAECDCNADMYEGSHRPECAVWIAEDSLSSAVDALPAEPAPPVETP